MIRGLIKLKNGDVEGFEHLTFPSLEEQELIELLENSSGITKSKILEDLYTTRFDHSISDIDTFNKKNIEEVDKFIDSLKVLQRLKELPFLLKVFLGMYESEQLLGRAQDVVYDNFDTYELKRELAPLVPSLTVIEGEEVFESLKNTDIPLKERIKYLHNNKLYSLKVLEHEYSLKDIVNMIFISDNLDNFVQFSMSTKQTLEKEENKKLFLKAIETETEEDIFLFELSWLERNRLLDYIEMFSKALGKFNELILVTTKG